MRLCGKQKQQRDSNVRLYQAKHAVRYEIKRHNSTFIQQFVESIRRVGGDKQEENISKPHATVIFFG